MRALAMAVLLLGCGQLDPELGAEKTPTEGCVLEDSDPSDPVNFGEVRDEIFIPRCNCHTIAGGLGQTVGGLDLSDYDAMREGGRVGKENVVVPGAPCESVIIQKTGEPPPFGARMPLSGLELGTSSRQKLIDWIAEGARR